VLAATSPVPAVAAKNISIAVVDDLSQENKPFISSIFQFLAIRGLLQYIEFYDAIK